MTPTRAELARWENKVVVVPTRNVEAVTDTLNQMGDEGWEPWRAFGTDTSTVIFFKRPRQPNV